MLSQSPLHAGKDPGLAGRMPTSCCLIVVPGTADTETMLKQRWNHVSILILTTLLLCSPKAFSQEANSQEQRRAASVLAEELEELETRLRTSPAWLLLEQAKQLREEGKLSEAITHLLTAQDKAALDPQIDVELAKVYLLTGDLTLTHHHLNLALQKKNGFPSMNQVYEVSYFMADLAWLEERYRDYEQLLLTLSAEDEHFMSSEDFDRNLRDNYRRSLLERGLDRTLVLYRIPDSFSLIAHKRLGIFYVQTGRYSEAIDHLLFAVLKTFTRIIEEYRVLVPDFQFSSIADFMGRIEQHKGFQNYLDSVGIYESMYYLAEAIFGQDQSKLPIARELWAFLATRQDSGVYSGVSQSQLRSPRTYLGIQDQRGF